MNVIFTIIMDRYTYMSLLLTQYMSNVINNLRKASVFLIYIFPVIFIPFYLISPY